MAHEIRRAVIRRISEQKRVSLSVASYIYSCKPIAVKMRLCEQEAEKSAISAQHHQGEST